MSQTRTPSTTWLNRLDRTGSVLSTLCAIHCLAMPFVAVSLPLWGLAFLGSRGWERFTATAMVMLAAFCLWQGCRRHGRWWLLALLGSGAAVVLGTQFLSSEHSTHTCCAGRPDWTEAAFLFAGGLTIAVAHGLNLHYRKQCHCRLCPGAQAEALDASTTQNP